MSESYVALVGRPYARRLLGALAAAWLSFGMVGLAIFLAVHRATGSFGIAGVAVAAFSIGSGGLAPLRGRVLDVRGIRLWLPIFASFYCVSALAGLIFVVAPWSPLVVAGLAALLAALLMGRGARAESRSATTRARPRSPLTSAPMRVLLVVSVAQGVALGLVEIAVPTAATRWGVAAYSGFLLGAFALGSIAGGLWFGRP